MAVDTIGIFREIYGPSYNLHYGIYERSVAHRKHHGESQCDVYPSTAIHSLWPLLAAMVGAERFLEVGCGLGYTAALMAEAGGKSARVDTIEKSAIHATLAAEEISNAGLEDRMQNPERTGNRDSSRLVRALRCDLRGRRLGRLPEVVASLCSPDAKGWNTRLG